MRQAKPIRWRPLQNSLTGNCWGRMSFGAATRMPGSFHPIASYPQQRIVAVPFDPATGKRVAFRTIADTFCRDNRVWDEWLIRDNAAIAYQLGHSAQDAARASIVAGDRTMPLTPASDISGPYSGAGNTDAWGERHASI
jgi:hypothetical protein